MAASEPPTLSYVFHCNRCNLAAVGVRHPGKCTQCGCPEFRMEPQKEGAK